MKLRRFFRYSRRQKPDDSSLTAQIASTVSGFVRIRGLDCLVESKTAIVMRKNYEVSITQDVDGLENRESVVAAVYLKDIESYSDFKNIQSNVLTRNDALGHMATLHLADQTAKRLLEQFGLVGRNNGNPGQKPFRHPLRPSEPVTHGRRLLDPPKTLLSHLKSLHVSSRRDFFPLK